MINSFYSILNHIFYFHNVLVDHTTTICIGVFALCWCNSSSKCVGCYPVKYINCETYKAPSAIIDEQIAAEAKESNECKRLFAVSGIGPLIAVALCALIGNGL